MKKLVTAGLVIIALLLLLPAAVGVIAEKNYRALMQQSQELTPGLRYVVEDYERGWFQSSAQYRLEVDPAQLVPAEQADDLPPSFALLSQAAIHHGPVFFTALGNPGGSLGPGLALSLDELSVRGPSGEQTEIPGHVATRLGFFGRHRSDIQLEALDTAFSESDQGRLKWAGMHAHTHFNSGLDDLRFDVEIGDLELASPAWQLQLTGIGFSGHQHRHELGFWLGEQQGRMGVMRMNTPEMQGLLVGPVDWQVDATLADSESGAESVNFALVETFEAIEVQGWKGGPVVISVAASDLDAVAVGELLSRFKPAPGNPAPDPAAAVAQLQALLVNGPVLDLRELRFGTPDGELQINAKVNFPATGPGELGALVLGLEAEADFKIPVALVARLASINPELQAQVDGLIGGGLLQRDGELLVMVAVLKGGLLTVNGQPMPLPAAF